MIDLRELKAYPDFEKALKNLIFDIDSDIINMKIDCRKSSENISVTANREDKFNIKL